jgi:hypothetical protein
MTEQNEIELPNEEQFKVMYKNALSDFRNEYADVDGKSETAFLIGFKKCMELIKAMQNDSNQR